VHSSVPNVLSMAKVLLPLALENGKRYDKKAFYQVDRETNIYLIHFVIFRCILSVSQLGAIHKGRLQFFLEIFDPPSPTFARVHRLATPLLWTSALGIKTPLAMHFF